VTAIKLLTLEWGDITTQGTNIQATTFETWQTTYKDGSTEQDRDRNVYTLVQQNGSWTIQEDDHPDSNLNQPPGSGPAAARPSPGASPSTGVPGSSPAPSPSTTTGTDQSENWSGYAATGGTFTGVSGAWTVPQVSGTTGAADATWVGIGGTSS